MRIVFMGTPEFAVPSLGALIDAGHEIAGVFTQPDKPKGRGYQLTPPPVKELALAHSLPVFQPQSLKTDEAKAQVSSLHPELIVVVAYGKLLPKEILDCPPLGCVNVHGSLLPKYRGAGPIQWSVLNGEAVTGVRQRPRVAAAQIPGRRPDPVERAKRRGRHRRHHHVYG